MITLPLTNNPEEKFSLAIYDNVYNLRQLRNTIGFWTLDINDEDGEALVLGVKLVTKTYLLAPYPNVRFELYGHSDDDPTRDNLNEFILEVTNKDV